MNDGSSSWRAWVSAKPFAVWVIFGALLYFGVGLVIFIGPLLLATPGDPIGISTMAFAAILLVAAFASLRGKRWTFGLSAGVTILFLILFGPFIAPTLANPADPSFWLAISGVPALILGFVFSILCLRSVKAGLGTKPYLASVRSTGGLLTIVVVGFVIGGLIVGNIAATAIARVLQGVDEPADIRIVPNAMMAAVPFDPANLVVSVGATVVWFNGDTATHTVTSNVTGRFSSPSLGPGDTFRVTFDEAGTFRYFCGPHPRMTGTVTVT